MNNQNQIDSDEDEFQVMTTWPVQGQPFKIPTPPIFTNPVSENQKIFLKPIDWSHYFDDMFFIPNGTSIYRSGTKGPIFLCFHGAGHSALSFALLAKQVKKFGILISFDFKGHGASKNDQNKSDFSINTLIKESIEILQQIGNRYPDKKIILIGHSMGGSVCTRVSHLLKDKQKKINIVGMVIIDVIEGTALEALPQMNRILSERPKHFNNPEQAIKWTIESQTLFNFESARVSIPSQLKSKSSGKLTWKVNLKKTEKFWQQWFQGLSNMFLSCDIPKILLTPHRQRLDELLIKGEKDGRFGLFVLDGVGHSVQEDNPKGVASIIYNFIKDIQILEPSENMSIKEYCK